MFDDPDLNRFFYVIAGAAIALALLWYFVIAPFEKRNHERKLAILQEKIKSHEETRGDPAAERDDQERDRSSTA